MHHALILSGMALGSLSGLGGGGRLVEVRHETQMVGSLCLSRVRVDRRVKCSNVCCSPLSVCSGGSSHTADVWSQPMCGRWCFMQVGRSAQLRTLRSVVALFGDP